MQLLRIRTRMEHLVDTLSNEQLGERLRWYIKEANHGGDWNNFRRREFRGIIAFLTDLYLWIDNYVDKES